jgi:hypothetical protein
MSPQQIQNRLKNPQKPQKQRYKAQRAQLLWSLLVAFAVATVALQQVVSAHNAPLRTIAAVSTAAPTQMIGKMTEQTTPQP